MTKVSIIVPTYNREKYVNRCLDSLINQTLKDIEIIIVDDGSTDNTKNIINEYKDKRIKYIYKENTGIGETRNLGIENAIGEYISFVDIDDFLDKTMIEKCYNKAINDNLDIVICDYIEINEETTEQKQIHLMEFNNTTLEDLPELINKTNLGPCNKIIKRSLFKDNVFPTNIKYEDMSLVIKLYKNANKIGKINEYLSYFLIHKNSETTTVDTKIFDIFKSLDIIRNTLKDNCFKEELDKLIISKLTDYNIQQRYQKNKNIANKFIDESFKYIKKYCTNYKKNKYFKEKRIKSIILKNKSITKIYCNLYRYIYK